MSEQTTPAEATEAERERELLAGWFIERAPQFDPTMLQGMQRGAAGCFFAIEHGDNHEFVSLRRDEFIKLVKSASQPQMQPANYCTREP
jgi:hypothetical protein